DDSRKVLRASASLALVIAAIEQRREQSSLANIKRTCSLRSVHLVAGDGEQVATDLFDVEGDFPGGLNGVSVKVDVGFASDFSDGFDRLQYPSLVVGGHDADEPGVRSNGGADCFGIDQRTGVDWNVSNLAAARFECLACIEHGVVLD